MIQSLLQDKKSLQNTLKGTKKRRVALVHFSHVVKPKILCLNPRKKMYIKNTEKCMSVRNNNKKKTGFFAAFSHLGFCKS